MSASNQEGSTLDDRQRRSPAIRSTAPASHATVAPARKRWLGGPFVRLLATNMAVGFSLASFYLLPKHLTVAYAASPGQIGAVIGVFGLTCVVVVPWLGRAVTALGLARTLVLAQLLLAACAFAFAALSGIGPAMMLLRALQGLATAGILTASVAMVCELAPPAKLTQAMGLAGAASLLMNAVAPVVAEPLGERYGFAWVFVLAGAAALLGALVARRLPATAAAGAETTPVPLSRHSLGVLFVLACTGAGFHVVMTFLAPLALSRGIGAVRGFFVAYISAALAVRVLGGALTERFGLRRVGLLALVIYGGFIAAMAGLGPRSMPWLGLGFGMAHGALFPALMALLFQDAPAGDRARLAAYANGVINVGMLSVFGLGLLANHAGLVSIFLLAGGLVAASGLALVRDRLRLPFVGRSLLVARDGE
jgi:MFS family permease